MWVSRDKFGHLLLFVNKCPFRDENDGMWVSNVKPVYLEHTLFPELKWEEEPIEVELKIKGQ